MAGREYYIDPMGEKVPTKYVKPYDKKRDRIANQIAKLWWEEQKRLQAVKAKTMALVDQLQTAAADAVDIKDLGGAEGNIQFRSFDGSVTVRVDNAKRTEFDERLQLAQRLIMEAVQDLAQDANADLVEIATKAFQPRKSGGLDMQRVRDLRSYNVKHPKWLKAIEIISECERVIGHKRYPRVTIRANKDSKPEPVVLDIAKL